MTVRIALVGDRGDHTDDRDLEGARALLGPGVESWWVAPGSTTMRTLSGFDAVWLAPGSPSADDEAVRATIRWAREQGVPFLGTRGSLRCAVAEFRSTVLGMPAALAEVDGPTPQTARLLQQYGWVVRATTPDAGAEVLTLPAHPFFVLTLAQPQVGVFAGEVPPPVVHAFVDAARHRARYREHWEATQAREAAIATAEAEPRPFVHQMRGPRHRWWRPLVAGLVATLTWFLLTGAVTGVFAVAGLVPETLVELGTDPWGSLYGNLVLIALIPATMLGLWAGHRRSPWRVLSVTGRVRWGWLLWCAVVVTPLWGVYLALSWVVFDQEVLPRSEQWVGLVVVSLLTTPLQAAAEEVAFRGGLVQSVGSWFRSPVVALGVTTILSTATFAAAHGSLDPWIVIEIGSLAVAGCYLVWRTGGLEAAIVVHVVNNVLITVSGAVLGGLEESYVDVTSTGSPVSALIAVVAMSLVTTLLVRLARRRGIAPSGWLTPARG